MRIGTRADLSICVAKYTLENMFRRILYYARIAIYPCQVVKEVDMVIKMVERENGVKLTLATNLKKLSSVVDWIKRPKFQTNNRPEEHLGNERRRCNIQRWVKRA